MGTPCASDSTAGVQSGMRDAKRGALEKVNLRRSLHNNGSGRYRAYLLRPEMPADGRNQLVSRSGSGFDNRAKDAF